MCVGAPASRRLAERRLAAADAGRVRASRRDGGAPRRVEEFA